MRTLLILTLLALPACVGKNKALCFDIQEGGNAHLELGYFYDSVTATVTGPMRISTHPEKMKMNTCEPAHEPSN
jgi:hypothetical protein